MIFLKVVYFLRFEDEVSLRFEDDKAQLCLTLCDPMDYSLPGSSVQGIFEARILEWVTINLLKVTCKYIVTVDLNLFDSRTSFGSFACMVIGCCW